MFFRVKWLQPAVQTYLVCAAGAAAVVVVPSMCFATSGCSCVRSSMRILKPWLQIAMEWLHECCMGYVVGRKPERETLCFSMYKWLQPTMKGTSCVRQLRLRSFWFLLCVLQQVVVPVCVVLCVSWISGCRSHWNGCMNVAWAMLWGGSRGTKPNLVFFRVRWLQRLHA